MKRSLMLLICKLEKDMKGYYQLPGHNTLRVLALEAKVKQLHNFMDQSNTDLLSGLKILSSEEKRSIFNFTDYSITKDKMMN